MRVCCLGLSYRTAPVEIRERLALTAEATPAMLGRIREAGLASEAVWLSTCNRVEIYAAAEPESVDGLRQWLLDHGRGWQTLYAHLQEAEVLPGAQLAAGERLGRVGQSGRASTAHLHVELRRRTPAGMVALDPTPLLADAVAALAPPQALQAQGLRPASP